MRQLGEGGQGAVFEAVRDDGSFQQRAAIKIVKWEIDSEEARARFRQERRILAGLDHPNIARLLDGGQTESGTPYLVMEFIEGQRLTTATEGWPQRRKLELFLQVMEAVAFAHRNLIVHRDLKPANIVVAGDGTPKLLDFGIAKLLDPDPQRTQTMRIFLTPDYASPEQVRGEAISTASDVYSLGVVLYELLTGRRPYRLDTITPLEMDRVICRQAPAAPGLGDELDHILMMALRKEPERRYHSVEQFAEDIERYLDHRPVMARPDTVWYRTRKYARRHWIGLVAASIALAGVCGGAAATAYEARKARRQFNSVRELANRFPFDFHDEIATVPGTVKAREMIVSTALEYLNRLAGEASRDPGLQWELAQAFAKVAKVQGSTNSPSLRRPRDGVASFEKALSLARPLADRRLLNTKQHEDLVNMLCDAEGFYWVIGRYDDAVRVGREAIARSDGLSSFMRGRPLGEMSITLSMSGDLAGSLEYVERLLPISRENARLDPSFINRRRLAETLDNLANTSLKLTALDGALAAGTEALGIFRSLAAERPDEPRARRSVIIALVHLGDILGAGDGPSLGRYAEAVERYEEALAVITPLLADPKDRSSQHDAGILRNKIAYTLRGLDPARAIREAAAATELMDTTSPDSPTSRAEPRIAGADAYRELRQYAQAERLLKEAGQVLKAPGSGDEAELALSEARLESARKGHGTGDRFQRAIALEEQVFQKAPRPANAWALARALELAAGALPESATGFRHRIEEVWNSQRQRYPGRAWIEMQWSESRAALSGR